VLGSHELFALLMVLGRGPAYRQAGDTDETDCRGFSTFWNRTS